ncbi:VOC family protein [Thioclava sp. FR2]|uniref:VOC family protein n=1 Tax=Thioclava sp. FR2 TaxID=3445780 RepID=UPI003EB8083C
MSNHGLPCWYELTSTDLKASARFYGQVCGWTFVDAGVPGFDYTLAKSGDDMVAGLFAPESAMPCFWMVYFVVDDCDAAAAKVAALGGNVHKAPADIPGTGRFAIVTDPQGAVFGMLQPNAGDSGKAYAAMLEGHGCWHQLEAADPAAALAFYSDLLGWAETRTHPMGDHSPYRIIAAQGQEFGGIMEPFQPDTPSHWRPFFGVASATQSLATVERAGGSLLSGPDPVPGGAFVATVKDDQGVTFSLVGGA